MTPTADEEIKPAKFLRHGEGGYAGQPTHEYDAGWWQPIQIKEPKEPLQGHSKGELQFLRLTDRARAELTLQATQRLLVERLVDKTVREPSSDLNLPATLYELLLPNELKDQPLESTNLLLLLDSATAQYPWEMLAERVLDEAHVGDEPLQPLSVRVGMVRQLESMDFRSHIQAPRSPNALVIGEPLLDDPSYPALPGAQAEAEAVASVLENFGYTVTKLIQKDAVTIIGALYAKEYRIIHVAGHGIYQPKNKKQSGVVLGKDIYLTPAEIGQLRVVPELVFLNCCHLGRIDAGPAAQQDEEHLQQQAWNKLAASVSETLINIGVRAVVAAGWAVNDRAARLFAETLYGRMLDTDAPAPFGDAIRMARVAIYDNYRHTNTWGAYQCYGDPGFALKVGASSREAAKRRYVSFSEVLREVENYQASASRTTDKGWRTRYQKQVVELEQRIKTEMPKDWYNGELMYALGAAYSELQDFRGAIMRFEEALSASGAAEQVPIQVVEQIANLSSRYVWMQYKEKAESNVSVAESGPVSAWSVKGLLDNAQKKLESLVQLAPTAHRYALLASCYKRRAMVSNADEERRHALTECAENYEKAYEMSQNSDTPYSGLNWINAQVLAGIEDDAQRAKLREAFNKSLQSDPSKTSQDFWARVKPGDIELTRLLLEGAEDAINKMQSAYEQVFRLGGTTRERSTVIENLEFVVAMLHWGAQEKEANKLAEEANRWREKASRLQTVVDVLLASK
ncbi:MAG: CHAT domain-containing protein [Caldilineaceae bacterium]